MKRTILITGASSGIGKATALFFQRKGWNVSATMRNPGNENELTHLENVIVPRLDVLEPSSINTAIGETISRFGKIDVVVNNAGYGMLGLFESASKQSIERLFGVNVFGLFDVTRAVLPHFRENRSGLFINVSSNAGKITYPLSSLYHSTKFAVEGFSESLRYEMASIGVDVKIIEPGAIYTDFGTRSLVNHKDDSLVEYAKFAEPLLKRYQEMVDPRKMSSPELVAEIIFTAATDNSDQLRYVAGADAQHLLETRKIMTDNEFMTMLAGSLGIFGKKTA